MATTHNSNKHWISQHFSPRSPKKLWFDHNALITVDSYPRRRVPWWHIWRMCMNTFPGQFLKCASFMSAVWAICLFFTQMYTMVLNNFKPCLKNKMHALCQECAVSVLAFDNWEGGKVWLPSSFHSVTHTPWTFGTPDISGGRTWPNFAQFAFQRAL